MLMGADVFMHATYTFRNVWIGGRYGGGKTLLSVAIADYLANKYKFSTFSNTPVYLPSSVKELKPCDGTTDACNEQCQGMIEMNGYGRYN